MDKTQQNNLHFRRSEDVQEILSKPPSSLISWGTGSLLSILMVFVFLSIYIKYPETITGEAKLTTSIDPSLIYNLSDGYLEKLHVNEDSTVKEGQVLGEIRNALMSKNITYLDQLIIYIRSSIKNKTQNVNIPETTLSFGFLQENYNTLIKQIYDYNQVNNSYHVQAMDRLQEKIEALESLSIVLKEKLDVGAKELQNAKVQYQIDEGLYKESVIAKTDWIERTSIYHQKVNEFQNLKQSLLQNNLLIKETESQLADLRYKSMEAKEKVLKEIDVTITSIENFKLEWKQKYTFIAPIDGKINFIKKVSPGDFLKSNQPIAYIIPQSRDVKAKVSVSYKGFGKIKIGQRARITLDAYPFQEFGHIEGTVQKVSRAPSDDKNYEIIIELPDNLVSSFKYEMPYKPNSVGLAEIVTQNYSVFERLMFSSRNALKKLTK